MAMHMIKVKCGSEKSTHDIYEERGNGKEEGNRVRIYWKYLFCEKPSDVNIIKC